MNIFILDQDPQLAAQYHCDKHVVKMILESAQMMCTALFYAGLDEVPYKATHHNHPCTKWVGQSVNNYNWLGQLAFHLNAEYMYRYDKSEPHKSWTVIQQLPNAVDYLPDIPQTKFTCAMEERYKVRNSSGTIQPVESYRQYYRLSKRDIAKWTKRLTPTWFNSYD